MHFIISKIYWFFFAPFNWIIVLLTWRLFIKSPVIKKRLTTAIIVLILFFGNESIFLKSVNAWQAKPVILSKCSNYEAGILLGGLSSFDKYGNGFLNTAADRLVEICILYKTKKIKRIIISGGSLYKNRPKEADFLYKKLLSLGVPKEDLIIENKSRTTFENAVYSKQIIDSLKLQPPFVLVTSAVHIPRAEKVFTKAGLHVIAFPSDFRVLNKRLGFANYVIPGINVINDWPSFLKKVIGLFVYKLLGKA